MIKYVRLNCRYVSIREEKITTEIRDKLILTSLLFIFSWMNKVELLEGQCQYLWLFLAFS